MSFWKNIGRYDRLGYGIGGAATGAVATVPGLVLLFFMTEVLAIPPALAGTIIFIPRLWDVVTDPLMGVISDRTRSRWGRRRPWLLAGALAFPVMFALTFSVPYFDDVSSRYTWVLLCYVGLTTTFTMFAVPFIAMPAEMTHDPHERTRIMAWRMGAMVVGILLAGGLAGPLIELGGSGRSGHALMGVVIGGITGAFALAAFFGTAQAPERVTRQQSPSFVQQWRVAVGNKRFLVLLASLAISIVGVHMLLAITPYMATYLLGGGADLVSLFFVCHMLPALFAMPFLVKLSARIGKKRAHALSMIAYGSTALTLWLLVPLGLVPVLLGVSIMGVAFGGTQLYSYSLLGDVIEVKDGSQNAQEGAYTGLWVAGEKTGAATGVFIAGITLSMFGFVESGGREMVEQTEQAILGVKFGATVLPALFLALGAVALFAFPDMGDAEQP